MRRAAVSAALLVLVLAAACGGDEENEAGTGAEVTVELAEQNDSGQSGTATLTADGDSTTRVVIELENGTPEAQPAHVHPGSCADLDPEPKHGLTNVVDGRSETTVQAPLSELAGAGLAINVHKSAAEVQTYVACGDIGGGGDEDQPASNERDYGY
jgi:hypothetical protein